MDVYLKYYENMYRRDDLFCVCKHKKLDFLRNTRSLQHREGELVIPERRNYKRYKETITPLCCNINISNNNGKHYFISGTILGTCMCLFT